ncbi:MAG: ectonucleotide pyrophosphatase/phosphodiesterase [Cytophagales bacterium]|nr:ectonucleotide pyrophosphatase/phosphodiesterase [Cytophagales bacterium]
MKLRKISLFSFIAFFTFIQFDGLGQDKPYVLLVSFDGFRHDYVEKYNLPNFKKFIQQGSAAKSLVPSFPSKTFPNHYTLVTGLYPGNHGLIANTFFAPERKTTYGTRDRSSVEDPYYYGGTPLWQLTRENGLKSASYFWVGSEAPIKGHFPDFYYIYDGRVPNNSRIDQVKTWLELPSEERPHFISLYFSLVDTQGHRTGPNSKELQNTVIEADSILGYLMETLDQIDLPVNTILVSDHGMINVNTLDVIDAKAIAKEIPGSATMIKDKIISFVYLPQNEVESTYQRIKALENNFRVFKKGELPKKWHYNENDRIGDLVLLANPGYAFRPEKVKEEITGEHGYDPYTTTEMHGIFYANGPNIKKGKELKSIENVHVFPLVTKILGFENPPIDGKFSKVKKIYKK